MALKQFTLRLCIEEGFRRINKKSLPRADDHVMFWLVHLLLLESFTTALQDGHVAQAQLPSKAKHDSESAKRDVIKNQPNSPTRCSSSIGNNQKQ